MLNISVYFSDESNGFSRRHVFLGTKSIQPLKWRNEFKIYRLLYSGYFCAFVPKILIDIATSYTYIHKISWRKEIEAFIYTFVVWVSIDDGYFAYPLGSTAEQIVKSNSEQKCNTGAMLFATWRYPGMINQAIITDDTNSERDTCGFGISIYLEICHWNCTVSIFLYL